MTERHCRRKRLFTSRRNAKRAAKRAKQRGLKLYAYECPECFNWHLTSMSRQRYAAMRRDQTRW